MSRPCVILQSHMDMVCEKNSDTAFDFDRIPSRTKIVDGWVKAEGTTLGADDGIGMAASPLAALLDPALEHGPLGRCSRWTKKPVLPVLSDWVRRCLRAVAVNLDSRTKAKFSSAAPAALIRWLRSVIRRRPHLKPTPFSGFGYPTFRADTPATTSIRVV